MKRHGEKKQFDSFISGEAIFFRAPDGESQVRVVPPTHKNHDHWGMKVHTHNFIGAKPTTYICVENTEINGQVIGGKCRVCEEMRYLKNNGAEKEEYSDFTPREGYVQYVVDRDAKKSEQIKIWHTSRKQDREIWEQTYSERTGEAYEIDNPHKGHDIIVKKSGKGKTGTSYVFKLAMKPTPLMRDERDQDDVLYFAEQNPLDERIKVHSYEEIDRNMSGTRADKDRDDERGGRDRDDDRDRGGRDRDDDRDRGGRDRDEDRDYSRRDRDDRDGDRERNDDDRPRGRGGDDRDSDDRGRDRDRDDRDDRSSRGRDRDDDRGRDRDDDDRDRDRGDDRDRDDRGGRSRDRDDGDRDRDRDDRGRDRDDDRGGRSSRSRY